MPTCREDETCMPNLGDKINKKLNKQKQTLITTENKMYFKETLNNIIKMASDKSRRQYKSDKKTKD